MCSSPVDDVIAQLLAERFGPARLPEPEPPWPVVEALTARGTAPEDPPRGGRGRGHLVVLDGGRDAAA